MPTTEELFEAGLATKAELLEFRRLACEFEKNPVLGNINVYDGDGGRIGNIEYNGVLYSCWLLVHDPDADLRVDCHVGFVRTWPEIREAYEQNGETDISFRSGSLDIEDLQAEFAGVDLASTRQRRALHRLGRSTSWIDRFARTRETADRAIRHAIAERSEIEGGR